MHPMQDLFLESFSYELQLDMHSYLHKNFILAKSGCYSGGFSGLGLKTGSSGLVIWTLKSP
jgi:hypothetical protein